ncbi:MAG: HEAT repeat domain-containing protein [Acidobacteria bacterium]|nr:HEAT repeat domain-containing protein [Acidobacteriota bacterium]
MGKTAGFVVAILILFGGTALAQAPRQRSVEGLIYDLKHPEADRRVEAARLLALHRLREAVPGLIEATQDPDDLVRLEALKALVRINDRRALSAYIRLTSDPKTSIQEKSIEGIINLYVTEEGGFIHGIKRFVEVVNPFSDDYNPLVVESYIAVDSEAVKAVSQLLSSADAGIRKDAALALGILRAQASVGLIQSILERETSNSVKVELIRALYKIADADAARVLVPFIDDPDKKVHDEAIFTSGRLRVKEAVPRLTEIYRSGVQERRKILGVVPASGADDLQKKVLEALAFIGDPSSKEFFVVALDDPRDAVRQYGAEGLARLGDSSVTTLVATRHLQEKSSKARLAMSFALFRLGREEHLVELVGEINDGSQAFDYLLELSPAEVNKLYPFLRSEKNSVQARVLDVIGLRGDASVLPVVQQWTQSESAEVVSAANLAIRRIQGRQGPSAPAGAEIPGMCEERFLAQTAMA